ncbi:hypothetical protein [Acidovorax sp. Leaf160]|uniref:hypothetical protein n=1 Tax=Acidovorax sp. Leaf160 TaxID=1736280 RepID=UPI000AA7EF6A|nr:hypothetical protein [Acidovorax sp. Leaf160]
MSNWMLLSDGREHYLSGIDALQNTFSLPSIAHHLSIINRFTGATKRPYSVAEHSLLCADISEQAGHPPHLQLACLMHDAHEAITGDMSSPAKWTVGDAWRAFEQPQARALRRHFGLLTAFTAHAPSIHQVDLIALATERRDLMPYRAGTHAPWPILDTPGNEVPTVSISLTAPKREQTHWTEWRDLFVQRFCRLDEITRNTLQQIKGPGSDVVSRKITGRSVFQ